MDDIKEEQINIIKKSHERSKEYGIEKDRIFPKRKLKPEEIRNNNNKNINLLSIATPFIKILYDFLKESGFLIILTDKDGCILNVVGDEDLIHISNSLNMVVGAYMSENSIGTNAMGVALHQDIPILISEKEHYIEAYHRWTCSAAPIHDINNRIIGTLNLSGDSDKVHPHTLGLVVAGVKSIENELLLQNREEKLIETYEYLNTVLDSISSGVYVVDKEGIVKRINKSACLLLGIKEKGIINKDAENILPDWRNIFERLKIGRIYENREVVLNKEQIKGRYNISATKITINDEVVGMVIVFKEMQNIINMVNKYSGRRAIYNFSDIIGDSKEIKNVIDYAKTISSSPSSVLIEGESGTGKELLAQAIHNFSGRKSKSFIGINCGAIPKSLIESELFGYEEGAFTGAKRGGHAGKFELANEGTLFLDEIGEMPLDMQVSLLRVLQEGYVTRVGGDEIIPVDVRIIAATNKNLKSEVEKGRFREDLYYRLCVIPIKIPPLRERIGDISHLIKYFFRMKVKKLNKPIISMRADIYTSMINYNWPGNIRELENCVENVVNLNGENSMFFGNNQKKLTSLVKDENNSNKEYEKIITLDECEKKAIIKAYDKYKGNMTKTSEALGITRATLYKKIKKYDIEKIQKLS